MTVLIKAEIWKQRQTPHREIWCEHEGRDQSDVCTSQGTPQVTSKPQDLGIAWNKLSITTWKEPALLTLWPGLLVSRTTRWLLLLFKHPGCGALLQQPWDTYRTTKSRMCFKKQQLSPQTVPIMGHRAEGGLASHPSHQTTSSLHPISAGGNMGK